MSIITENALNKVELMVFKLYYQVDIRRVKEMNKISKRLFSIGLSVATCSMLVYPVLAEDTEQPVTTQVEEQATQKEYNLQITKYNGDGTPVTEYTTFTLPSNADEKEFYQYIPTHFIPDGYEMLRDPMVIPVYKIDENTWALCIQKKSTEENTEPSPSTYTFNLTIDYMYEFDRNETKTVTIQNYVPGTSVSQYIMDNCVPEGYKFDSCYCEHNGTNEEDRDSYVLYVYKGMMFQYQTYIDGKVIEANQIGHIDHEATDEEIKEEIGHKYVIRDYDIESIEKMPDGVWRVNLVTAKKDNETFTLIINKDGKDTKSTIKISKGDQNAYSNVLELYIIQNYLPNGYHVDYDGGGIFSLGSNTYKMYLKKDKNETLKTYTLQLIKSEKPFVFPETRTDLLENASIEYYTFKYDSSLGEANIYDYICKTYFPKGYVWDFRSNNDNGFFRLRVFKANPEKKDSPSENYKLRFIDSATGNVVGNVDNPVEGAKKASIKSSEIDFIPRGYVFDGDTFKVIEENGELVVNVNVKKGDLKLPVTIKFYENVNGTLKKLTTVKTIAQEVDINKDGAFDKNDFQSCVPDGYQLEDWLVYSSDYIFEGNYLFGQNYSFVVNKKPTINQSEESKKIATIENKDLQKVLTSSLSQNQKTKVEIASSEGKSVDYRPVLKEKIDNKEKKELLAYVDKEDNTKVVSTFDIEIQLFVDDKNEGTISETSSELTFKVAIPENLKKEGRKFYVLRYHDGKVDKLAVSEDGTFKTDKFSSYMLVYEDTKSEVKPEVKPDETKPEVKPEVKPETKPSTKPEVKPETKPEVKPSTKPETKPSTSVAKKENKTAKKVNTGVKNSTALFTGLMGVSVAALGVVEVLKRRNK